MSTTFTVLVHDAEEGGYLLLGARAKAPVAISRPTPIHETPLGALRQPAAFHDDHFVLPATAPPARTVHLSLKVHHLNGHRIARWQPALVTLTFDPRRQREQIERFNRVAREADAGHNALISSSKLSNNRSTRPRMY